MQWEAPWTVYKGERAKTTVKHVKPQLLLSFGPFAYWPGEELHHVSRSTTSPPSLI